ncbi:MAG: extracellular solute-binding protein [Candidatus Competibacteraceae bacterium]|nr:extracellular solute-binding protein [Candidatus Competibacteraceae bacterium]
MARFKDRYRGLLLTLSLLLPVTPIPAQDKPAAAGVAPVHAIAMHGQPKYGPDFQHFDYVNPAAPKGGEMRRHTIGNFDTLNPFVVRGDAPAGIGLLFESLVVSSADEAFTEYGLIAESIEMPEDRSWVIYNLRPEARFHDGSPISADDVIFSFETLRSKGAPFYRFYYANVASAEKLGERRVKFTFSGGPNQELPLIMGQLPVIPRAYWEERDFEATTLKPPVGSGPYRIAAFEPGRYIVYQRDPDYRGRDLPVNRGRNNFDRIRFDFYRDSTVSLEAFKAEAYDIRPETSSKDWATGYAIPAVARGELIKGEFPHQRPSGMQGFAFNLRRPLFQDPRVRQALAYAFDFQWSNQNLFYGQYTRTDSYFDNSELAAQGLPSKEELELLEPLRGQIPEEVFTSEYRPPSTEGPNGLRQNLRQALLLLQEAGWTVRDRRLVHGESGRPFEFEILIDQPIWERIALPFARNLERLGIAARVRQVDSAQYQNRMRSFDFDMTVESWGQSLSPGNEQREFWGSQAAKLEGSRNRTGVQDPAIDQLIQAVIAAPDRDSLVTRVQALDRVLLWNHLVVPHWHIPYDRVAYWDKFGMPETIPMQGIQLDTWWYEPDKARGMEAVGGSGG